MPSFSMMSRSRLNTCHPDLIRLFVEVVKEFDCSILCGHRDEVRQREAFNEGRSKLLFPKSKHNSLPSNAIDVSFYPIDWKNIRKHCYFAGYVMGVADALLKEGSISHKIRWGGDFNMNQNPSDQDFFDGVHFELIKEKP